MCGICGIIEREGTAANRAALEKMNALLLHRGPDDGGVFIKENAGLAMLAIKCFHNGKFS